MCDERERQIPTIEIDATNLVGEITIVVGGQPIRITRRHIPGESNRESTTPEERTREASTPGESRHSDTPTLQWPSHSGIPSLSVADDGDSETPTAALSKKSVQCSLLKRLEEERKKEESETRRRMELALQKRNYNVAEAAHQFQEVVAIPASKHELFLQQAVSAEKNETEQRDEQTLQAWQHQYVETRKEILRKQLDIQQEKIRYEKLYEKFTAQRPQLDAQAQEIIAEEEETRQRRIRQVEAIRQERLREECEALKELDLQERFQKHLLQQTQHKGGEQANLAQTSEEDQDTALQEEREGPFTGHRWPPGGRPLGSAPSASEESLNSNAPSPQQTHITSASS